MVNELQFSPLETGGEQALIPIPSGATWEVVQGGVVFDPATQKVTYDPSPITLRVIKE